MSILMVDTNKCSYVLMANEITIQGMDKVLDRLLKITDQATIDKALGKACAIVERSAKEKAPKGDGALRRSITSTVRDGVGIVFTPLEYAPYVEYGTGLFAEDGNGRKDVPWHYKDEKGEWHTTSGMNPSPYMRPAFNENRENIKRIIRGELTKK